MSRLPSVDATTQRFELMVFASLGGAGILMVVLAISQVTGEVTSGRDFNAARAGWTESSVVVTDGNAVQPAATNSSVCGTADAPAPVRARATRRVHSAVETGLSLILR